MAPNWRNVVLASTSKIQIQTITSSASGAWLDTDFGNKCDGHANPRKTQ